MNFVFILREKVIEMNKIKQKNILLNRKGMTLIEIIVSLAILAIIIVPFLNIFVQSTVTNKKSEVILDATYVAQRVMEESYNDSLDVDGKTPKPLSGIQNYKDTSGGNYWINKKISSQDSNNLVGVIVKIYSDESESDLKAQMETKLFWK